MKKGGWFLLISAVLILGIFLTYRFSDFAPGEASFVAPHGEVGMPEDPYRNYGSARMLTGNCLFLNVFVSDPESSIDEALKEKVLADMNEAAAFLKRQAEDHGKQLSVIYGEEDLLFDITVSEPVFLDAADPYWANRAVNGMDIAAIRKLAEKYRADSVGFILSLNKEGTNYTVSTTEAYGKEYFNEPCVVSTSAGAFAYAHEIMHLFGAKDLYNAQNPEDDRSKLAVSLFPRDIMVEYSDLLWQAKVCDVDAYLVGWQDTVSEEHLVFFD